MIGKKFDILCTDDFFGEKKEAKTLDMGYGAGMVQIVQMVDGKQELGRKEGEECTMLHVEHPPCTKPTTLYIVLHSKETL